MLLFYRVLFLVLKKIIQNSFILTVLECFLQSTPNGRNEWYAQKSRDAAECPAIIRFHGAYRVLFLKIHMILHFAISYICRQCLKYCQLKLVPQEGAYVHPVDFRVLMTWLVLQFSSTVLKYLSLAY